MKRIREQEIIENTLMHFPDDVSKDIDNYVINELMHESRYLFVTKHGNKKKAFCTHCKESQDADGLKHKEEFRCVNCEAICWVQFAGYSRTRMIDQAYFVYYEKSEINKDAMIARGFHVQLDFTGDYKNVKPQYSVMAKYLFEMDNPIMLKDYYGKWELRKSVFTLFAEYTAFGEISTKLQNVSIESIKEAVQDTPFQYSMWDKRGTRTFDDSVRYFATYATNPRIEYLSKVGLKDIVERKVYNVPMDRVINWRGKTLDKMLRLPKQQMKEVIKRVGSMDVDALKMYQENIREDLKLTLDEILDLRHARYCARSWNDLKELSRETSMRKLFNYLKKQARNEENHSDIRRMHLFLEDYHSGCKELGLTLVKDIAAYPSDIVQAHDNVYEQIEFKANEELNERIQKRLEELNQYIFENDTMILLPFESTDEIIEEGKQLKHCVGGYSKDYAEGKRDIFKIRKKDDLETPYYTLEISNGRVNQYYGYNNNQRHKKSEEVIAFVESFEKEILNIKEIAS